MQWLNGKSGVVNCTFKLWSPSMAVLPSIVKLPFVQQRNAHCVSLFISCALSFGRVGGCKHSLVFTLPFPCVLWTLDVEECPELCVGGGGTALPCMLHFNHWSHLLGLSTCDAHQVTYYHYYWYLCVVS